MAFKNPFTVAKLKSIKAQLYAKAFKVIVQNKLKDGDTVPFSIILNHVYAGFDASKSAKLPFFLLGEPKDGEANWKKFRDGDAEEGGKQKDYMVVGTCSRQGDHLMLTLNKSKGVKKIPRKTMDYLQKLLKNANPNLTIGTKEGAATTDDAVAGVVPEGDTGKEKPEVSDKKKARLLRKMKKKKEAEAKKLEKDFEELNEMSSSDAIKKVTDNIKRGRTTKKDAKAVKKMNTLFSSVEKQYKGSIKQVQEKFDKPYKELVNSKKKFYELSLATKESKKGLVELLAYSYYEKKEKRAPTENELKEMQEIIKDVILMNKKRRKKAKQSMLFKATSYVLRKTSPKNFKAKYVNQILQKKVA